MRRRYHEGPQIGYAVLYTALYAVTVSNVLDYHVIMLVCGLDVMDDGNITGDTAGEL